MRLPLTIILSLVIAVAPIQAQDILKATGVSTEFFSSAPIEDIAARANDGISLWNNRNGEVSFRVNIRSFEFEKGKMQEHFNENFMESHQYPHATFKGQMVEQPDISREGEFQVSLVGILEIHGIPQSRQINATVKVKENGIALESRFNIAVADHAIEIPKLLFRNIAEVVEVTVHANYSKLEL